MRIQFKIRTLLASCAFLAMYLSAYLTLREPVCVVERHAGGVGTGYHEPNFQYGGCFAKLAFFPATLIDKFCRPKFWNNYSTTDDVWTQEDYAWGRINVCNGTPCSLDLNADTEANVEGAFNALRADRRLRILRIKGVGFTDTHLETLQRIRKFDAVLLMGTNVSRNATVEYQRVSPKTEFSGVSITGEKYSRLR